jgi:hypothetical protein
MGDVSALDKAGEMRAIANFQSVLDFANDLFWRMKQRWYEKK